MQTSDPRRDFAADARLLAIAAAAAVVGVFAFTDEACGFHLYADEVSATPHDASHAELVEVKYVMTRDMMLRGAGNGPEPN